MSTVSALRAVHHRHVRLSVRLGPDLNSHLGTLFPAFPDSSFVYLANRWLITICQVLFQHFPIQPSNLPILKVRMLKQRGWIPWLKISVSAIDVGFYYWPSGSTASVLTTVLYCFHLCCRSLQTSILITLQVSISFPLSISGKHFKDKDALLFLLAAPCNWPSA